MNNSEMPRNSNVKFSTLYMHNSISSGTHIYDDLKGGASSYAMQMVVVSNLRPNVVFAIALQNCGYSTSYFAFLAYNFAEWTNSTAV